MDKKTSKLINKLLNELAVKQLRIAELEVDNEELQAENSQLKSKSEGSDQKGEK